MQLVDKSAVKITSGGRRAHYQNRMYAPILSTKDEAQVEERIKAEEAAGFGCFVVRSGSYFDVYGTVSRVDVPPST
jgi:hypothetical protein